MATFTILPNGVTGVNSWQNPGGSACAASNVDADNGDTDYCYENWSLHAVTFTFPNSYSVAESAIDTINSVTLKFKANYTNSSGTTMVRSYILNDGSADTGVNVHTIASGGYQTYTGPAETTYDGSNSWTYAKLDDIQVKLIKVINTFARTQIRVSYLYVEVDYDEAGYGHHVMGVDKTKIADVNGVPTTNISKVNGV